MLNIQPIKLLSGNHADTGTTGQGCFMNVIAYLNGEPQITDKSPCVCVTVRPIAIFLNDMADDAQRQRLVPYIERAMGSATEDRTELIRRAWLAADFAAECSRIANAAANAANAAAEYAEYAAKSEIFEAGLRFLDAALPPAVEVLAPQVLARAVQLCRLAEVA